MNYDDYDDDHDEGVGNEKMDDLMTVARHLYISLMDGSRLTGLTGAFCSAQWSLNCIWAEFWSG